MNLYHPQMEQTFVIQVLGNPLFLTRVSDTACGVYSEQLDAFFCVVMILLISIGLEFSI